MIDKIISKQVEKLIKEHCGKVFYSVRDKDTGQLKRIEAVEVITKDPEKLKASLRSSMLKVREEIAKQQEKELFEDIVFSDTDPDGGIIRTHIIQSEAKKYVFKAFDWIWSRWHLDYSRIDKAKASFINSIRDKGE